MLKYPSNHAFAADNHSVYFKIISADYSRMCISAFKPEANSINHFKPRLAVSRCDKCTMVTCSDNYCD